jgi:hypothetical protein
VTPPKGAVREFPTLRSIVEYLKVRERISRASNPPKFSCTARYRLVPVNYSYISQHTSFIPYRYLAAEEINCRHPIKGIMLTGLAQIKLRCPPQMYPNHFRPTFPSHLPNLEHMKWGNISRSINSVLSIILYDIRGVVYFRIRKCCGVIYYWI